MPRTPAESLAPELAGAMAAALDVARIDEVVRLASGPGADTYLVAAAGRRFIAKQVTPESHRTLPLEREFGLLAALSAAELTARPVAVDAEQGLLITEFLEGTRPMTPEEIASGDALRRIAVLLRRLHAHAPPSGLPRFDPIEIAGRYLGQLAGRIESRREQGLADEVRELAAGCSEHFSPAAICHNDLVAANILSGQGMRLVDFEYAVAASPVLDLASLAEMNALDAEQTAELLDIYHGSTAPPFSEAEFAKVRRLVTLLAHFWARAQPATHARQVESYLSEGPR